MSNLLAPNLFVTPWRGSAIHPILLSMYYTSPKLVKAINESTTAEGTFTNALKKTFLSLGSSNDSTPIWDLVGEKTLVPADCQELFNQICDLLDGELDNVAAKSFEIETTLILDSGALISNGKPLKSYTLGLMLPIRLLIDGCHLDSLIGNYFESEVIDYKYPDQSETVQTKKFPRFSAAFQEVFVLQLQRYRYDFDSMTVRKIYDKVEFPLTIEGNQLEQYADEKSKVRISSSTLSLRAVITHSDYAGYGLLLRLDENGPWFRCLDGGQFEESSIELAFGGEVESEVAYFLFYQIIVKEASRRLSGPLAMSSNAAKTDQLTKMVEKEAIGEKSKGCCILC